MSNEVNSSNSIVEIIGGTGGNGGLSTDSRSNVDAETELKVPNIDPDTSIHVYGAVAIAKVIVACLLWFWYFGNGKSTTHVLVDGYWRVWFSAFMAVMLSWGPVLLFYGLQFTGVK